MPLLERGFTCYMMSTRGRGLSAESPLPDYSLDRLIEDVVAMAESIGEPVGVVGFSLGGALSLGAAARSDVITAVAVYEPAVIEALDEKTGTLFAESSRAMAAAAGEGRLIEAARALLEPIAHEDELVALTDARTFQTMARNVPVALQEIEQADNLERPGPTALSTLERITVPVLYLLGSRASAWHRDGARYLSGHLDDFRVIEVDGAGHFGPLLSPEPIAGALVRFFSRWWG